MIIPLWEIPTFFLAEGLFLPLRKRQLKTTVADLSAAFKKQHNEDKYLAVSAASTTT